MTIRFKKSLKLRNNLMRREYEFALKWYLRAYRALRRTHSTNEIKRKSKALYTGVATSTKQMVEADLEELLSYTVDEFEAKTGISVDDSMVDTVVDAVISGKLYDTKWTLDRAVEGIDDKTVDMIAAIIESGEYQGKSEEEIIEEILAVLNPNDNKYQKSYTTKSGTLYIGRIDGATDRLMRTTLEHGYQRMIVELAQLVEEQRETEVMIRWISALAHNTCEVCESRHNELYRPEDLPLEHPNGQCEFCIEYT